MKRLNLLYVILLFANVWFCFEVKGQNHTDSLYVIWSDTTRTDMERVEIYYSQLLEVKKTKGVYEVNMWTEDLDEAIQLANTARKPEYLGLMYFMKSFQLRKVLNDLAKSCYYLELTTKNAKTYSNYEMEINGYSALLYFSCTKLYDHSLKDSLEALISIVEESDPMNEVLRYAYRGIARATKINFDYPTALVYYRKFKELSEALGLLDAYYGYSIEMLGIIHRETGNYTESEKYLLQALSFSQSNQDTFRIGSAYISLAQLYLKMKDKDRAISNLDSAFIMKDVTKCETCYIMSRRVRAGINNLQENYTEAWEELQDIAYLYEDEIVNIETTNLGKYYAERAKAQKGMGNYQVSIQEAQKGISKVKGNLSSNIENHEIVCESAALQGDFKTAYEHLQKAIVLKDSLTSLRNDQEVIRLELENLHTQEQLESKLAFQSQLSSQRNSRNLFLGLGLTAFFLAIALFSRLQHIRKTKTVLEDKNRIIEAEKEKAKASEQAKHQFLANMSHEIRTPMNAIKGMTDILLRREPQPQQLSYLSAIKESSNSLLVIINDILDMSKIEAGKVDLENIPFSLSEVIQNVNVISQFKAEEKGLQMQTNIDETSFLSVSGDPTRLHQILLNLVGNAIKFTEKGVVTIQLKTEVQKNENKMLAHFCVSDTGVGIGQNRLEKIFDSFEQAYSDTTRKFGGTGLGLSISKKLVELQVGKIWAESQKGKGSQFYFTIPYELAQEIDEGESSVLVNDNTASSLKGIKILLVEDNNFNAIVAKEELEDAIKDVVVEVAEHGVIAIEKVSHNDFDIILMDIQMPVMNGYEATTAIRNLSNGKAKIPIIAMTANVMKEEVERCYEAGMNDFIGKPFDTDDLVQKIQKLFLKN